MRQWSFKEIVVVGPWKDPTEVPPRLNECHTSLNKYNKNEENNVNYVCDFFSRKNTRLSRTVHRQLKYGDNDRKNIENDGSGKTLDCHLYVEVQSY